MPAHPPGRRVAMITHYFQGRGGGIELVAGRLARELAALGHDVTWAATGAPPEVPAPFRTLSLPASAVIERSLKLPMPLPGPAGLRALARLVRESDAVIVHDALYPTSVAAFLAARRHGKPVLLVQHIGAVPYKSPLLRLAMRFANLVVARPLLAGADQTLFISETTRAHFARLSFRRAPVTLFNGVDTEVFRPPETASETAQCRARFRLPSAGPVVLFVGRFVEKKGLPFVERLARERPDLTVAIAGSGEEDPRAWGLPNVVVAGALPPAALAELYRASDLLLLPSVGEGFPLVVQEALATGLPVVCGRDSAEADPLAAPHLGAVAIDLADPAGTAARLAAAIEEGLRKRGSEEERRARSDFARERYSWAATAARYDALLAGLLEGRAG